MTQHLEQRTWRNSNRAAPMAADSSFVCVFLSKRRAIQKNPIKPGFPASVRSGRPGNSCPLRQIFPPTGDVRERIAPGPPACYAGPFRPFEEVWESAHVSAICVSSLRHLAVDPGGG